MTRVVTEVKTLDVGMDTDLAFNLSTMMRESVA